jgi:sortase A
MRAGKLLLFVAVLALISAFAISCGGSSSQGSGDAQGGQQQGQEPNPAPPSPKGDNSSEGQASADAPEDTTLRLTVPKMERLDNVVIPTAPGDDEATLKQYHAIHLKGTGFPWQKEANVYIAGHRLGYAGTDSYLAFYDLNKLKDGDEIIVTDANGKKYTYKVNKEFVVDPTDVYVTEPIAGKNIVTLQACTLPDYSRRLIVQGELVKS